MYPPRAQTPKKSDRDTGVARLAGSSASSAQSLMFHAHGLSQGKFINVGACLAASFQAVNGPR